MGTLSSARCLQALALVAIAALSFTSLTASAARAGDLPFWEQADLEKASATKKSGAKKYAAKKAAGKAYASKKASKQYAKAGTKKLGGYAEATEPVMKKKHGVKVAALGHTYVPEETPKKSLSGAGVNWTASASCLDSSLRAVINQVASNYGSLRVNSTCRSTGHNRAVGGAPHSKHLSGDAVDFRVFGNVSAVYAYLKSNSSVGGLKHYGGGLFHIDNGERRSW